MFFLIFPFILYYFCSAYSNSDLFAYPQRKYQIKINELINEIKPKEQLIGSYSIDKKLPNGLFFSTVTGGISGKTNIINTNKYTITCQSNGNQYETVIEIEVINTVFGYPISLLRLLKLQNYTVSPTIHTEGDTYTLVSPPASNEITLDSATGALFCNHLESSAYGSKVVKVSTSSGSETEITVQFVQYLPVATVTTRDVYSFKCEVDIPFQDPESDVFLANTLDMFGDKFTTEQLYYYFPHSELGNYFQLNFTGFINIEEEDDYLFSTRSNYFSFIIIDDKMIVDYNVSNTCQGYQTVRSKTVHLTSGWHSIILSVFDGSKVDEHFDFQYRDSKSSTNSPITIYSTSKFSIASKLEFDKSSYSLAYLLKDTIAFSVDNSPYCQTSPKLPDKLIIKPNSISGKSLTEFTTDFSVACLGPNSITNKVIINIQSSNNYHTGLAAYYLKYKIFDPTPNNFVRRTDPTAILHVLRLEEDITKPYNATASLWPGLGPDFVGEFGVSYEGIINFEKPGDYSFKMTCDDYCWLFIGKYYQLSLNWDLPGNQTGEKVVKIEEAGYSPFRVEFTQYKFASVLELLYKAPGEPDWHYPSNILFYSPPGSFQYTYVYAIYIINEKIPNNKPILSSKIKPKSYHSETLPKGLMCEETTGEIWGQPTEATLKKEYVITATLSDDTQLTVTITITVVTFSAPTHVYLYNTLTHTNIESAVTVAQGSYVSFQITEDSGVPISYYLYDGVIPGLSFEPESGVISGYPPTEGIFPILIQAVNPVGTTATKINITVTNSCTDDTKLVHLSLTNIDGDVSQISVKKPDGFVVYQNVSLSGLDAWSGEFCLSENVNFSMSIYNTVYWRYYFHLTVVLQGTIILDLEIQGSNEGIAEVSFYTSSALPVLTYPTSIQWEQFTTKRISPQTNIPVISYTVNPEVFPKGITFDSATGIISGAPVEISIPTNYSIIGHVIYGDSLPSYILISYTTSNCESQGKGLLRFYVPSAGEALYVWVDVVDYRGMVVAYVNNSNLNPDHDFNDYHCLPLADYSIRYGNTNTNTVGWGNCFVDIFVQDALMLHLRVGSDPPDVENPPRQWSTTLSLIYQIGLSADWEYSTKYYKNWNKGDSTETWSVATLSSLPPVTGNTIYLRKKITTGDDENFSAFFSRLTVISGVVLYIDGTEVHRHNLPVGEITEDQQATSTFTEPVALRFVLPIDFFTNNPGIVAIELHKHSTDKLFPQIQFVAIYLHGDERSDCTNLNFMGGSLGKFNPPATSISPAPYSLFDGSSDSGWRSKITEGVYVEYIFGTHLYVYYNRFVLTTGDNRENFADIPKTTIVTGATDNEYFNLFTATLSMKDITMENQENQFLFYDKQPLISRALFNFTENWGARYVTIQELALFTCHIFYCEKTDILDYSEGGKSVTINCADGATGSRTFFCPLQRHPKWVETANSCGVKPKLIRANDKTFTAGKTELSVELFSVTGFVQNLTVTPPLPTCITMADYQIGLYNVWCTVEQQSQIYRFNASNNFGFEEFNLTLTVLSSNLPIISRWNASAVFYINVELTGVNIFVVYGPALIITVAPDLPTGLRMNPYTGAISGKPTVPTEGKLYKFTFTNDFGVEFLSIRITCVYEDKPNVIEYRPTVVFYYKAHYSNYSLFTVAGVNLTFSVDPVLPQSLLLTATGLINGVVEIDTYPSTVFTFTATNKLGAVNISITVSVEKPLAPVVIDQKTEAVIVMGDTLNLTLFNVVGDNIVYSVNPPLPLGLFLNTTTGQISGSLQQTAGTKQYQFFIENKYGKTSVSLTLSFSTSIEPKIVNPVQSILFYEKVLVDSFSAFTLYGRNLQVTVTPDLPLGLKINIDNGLLKGTPLSNSPTTSYTFTVKNEFGQETVTIPITVETLYCEAEGEWTKTKFTEKCVIKCAGSYTGSRERVCKMLNNKPSWDVEIDDCVLPVGLIAGVTVASVVALALIVLVIIFLCYRRNSMKTINKIDRQRKTMEAAIRL